MDGEIREGRVKNYTLERDFDKVERPDGSFIYKPKQVALMMLGKPPWTLTVPDTELIPEESTELVGVLEWRGQRYVLESPRDWDDVEMD